MHHVVRSIRSLLERVGILRPDAGDRVARAAAAQAALIAASRPEPSHRGQSGGDAHSRHLGAPRAWPSHTWP